MKRAPATGRLLFTVPSMLYTIQLQETNPSCSLLQLVVLSSELEKNYSRLTITKQRHKYSMKIFLPKIFKVIAFLM